MTPASKTRYAAIEGDAVIGADLAKRRSARNRLLIGVAALPFLLGTASAAEPLSDSQMDSVTAGRRGITVPLGANEMAVWWVVTDGAAPPFYWYGGNGWQSFLVSTLGSSQTIALVRPPSVRVQR
jgi:hypothetical protein